MADELAGEIAASVLVIDAVAAVVEGTAKFFFGCGPGQKKRQQRFAGETLGRAIAGALGVRMPGNGDANDRNAVDERRRDVGCLVDGDFLRAN